MFVRPATPALKMNTRLARASTSGELGSRPTGVVRCTAPVAPSRTLTLPCWRDEPWLRTKTRPVCSSTDNADRMLPDADGAHERAGCTAQACMATVNASCLPRGRTQPHAH